MRAMLVAITTLIAMVALSGSASAATCAEYHNQAAAQRAADTRDGDGDGIYCVRLPCPCATGSGGSAGGSTSPPPPPPVEATRCGVERWPVKTLTDKSAARVSFVAKSRTVDQLRALPPPDVRRGSPRLAGEFSTYRLRVRLRSMKTEDDSDIHLVVSDLSDATHTMIVEFPNAGCVHTAGATTRRRMAHAPDRAAARLRPSQQRQLPDVVGNSDDHRHRVL